MKLHQIYLGICFACLCFVQGVFAQVSNGEWLTPIEGVVIPKAHLTQQPFKPLAVFKDCDKCPEMVVIPAGEFLMGSPPDPEQDPFSDAKLVKVGEENEKPQHRVHITAFAIGKYEVTQEQWHAVMGNNPSSSKGRTLPVESVSWNDAQLFVQKLSKKTGLNYRLPSEAEWEYAARAGTNTSYFWGEDVKKSSDYAWDPDNSKFSSMPVGLKKPNQFGLYDMIGNVHEWTQDCWHENYDGAPTNGSAWMIVECSAWVLRGSSYWRTKVRSQRSAYRATFRSEKNWPSAGFRVARDL